MSKESSNDASAPAAPTEAHSAPPPPKLPVNEKWLVNLINEKSGTKGVLKGHACEIIGEGKGFLSVITRVTFDWDSSSKDIEKLPKGIIIKQPTLEKIKAFPMDFMKEFFTEDYVQYIHNNECNTYEFLSKYQPCPLPMARVFLLEKTTADPDSGMIILEDITDASISLAVGERATIEQACLMAKYIGQIQGYGLNHPDLTDTIFPMKKDPSTLLRVQIPAGFEAFKADQPDKVFFTLDHVFELEKKVLQGFDIYKNPVDYGLAPVLVLGDLQPNNILWHRNDKGKTSNTIAAMIDFQLAHVGYCATDLTQILNQSFSAKMRQENQQLVLDTYYNALIDTYEKGGGAKGKCPVTKEEVEQNYKKGLCFFSVIGIASYPMLNQFKDMFKLEDSFIEESIDSMIETFVELGIKDLVQ